MRLARGPWLELALLVVASLWILAGAAGTPFHPDETSLLFQSRDLERLASDPAAMAWRRSSPQSPDLTYRLLNAPLPKVLLGLGRLAAGFPDDAVAVDWDWSKSWNENEAAGALPPGRLLAAVRVVSAALLLPAIVALYFAGRALGGRATGLASAILLATNALVLLHGRRAMAEGTLVFAVSIAVLGLMHADRRSWLAGLAAGLAAAAKTSAAIWVPLGLLAVAWPGDQRRSLGALLLRLAEFTAAAGVVVFLLHPVSWSDPIGAAQAMWRARQDLVAAQVETIERVMPGMVLAAPIDRLASMLVHLYFAPLQFAEAANYMDQTAAAEAAYLAAPGHNLLRSLSGGAVLLGLGLLGLVTSIRGTVSPGGSRRAALLLGAATLVQAGALVAFVPLGFQRYWIPIVPLACLWAGHGLASLIGALKELRWRRSKTAEVTRN